MKNDLSDSEHEDGNERKKDDEMHQEKEGENEENKQLEVSIVHDQQDNEDSDDGIITGSGM